MGTRGSVRGGSVRGIRMERGIDCYSLISGFACSFKERKNIIKKVLQKYVYMYVICKVCRALNRINKCTCALYIAQLVQYGTYM